MNFIDKFNNYVFNKKSIPVLVGVLSIGLLLIVFSGDLFDEQTETKVNKFDSETIEKKSDSSLLEKNNDEAAGLEDILSQIKNVGTVKVRIIYKSTSEKLAMTLNDENGNETAVFENENSISKPFVTKERFPEIAGVIIVATGGGDLNTKNEIINAVSDVYNIPIHKVKVFEMK